MAKATKSVTDVMVIDTPAWLSAVAVRSQGKYARGGGGGGLGRRGGGSFLYLSRRTRRIRFLLVGKNDGVEGVRDNEGVVHADTQQHEGQHGVQRRVNEA